jgi:hypothetical protein
MAERDEFTISCFGSFPLPIESSVWFQKAAVGQRRQRVDTGSRLITGNNRPL